MKKSSAQKPTDPKTAISFILYLSKVNDKLHVALDGNILDMADFGIDALKFTEIGKCIDDIIQIIMKRK